MRHGTVGLILAATLLLPSPVSAGTVAWTVIAGAIQDGGVLTGSFVYDADTNIFSSVALTTTAGTIRSGASYVAPNFCCGPLVPFESSLLFVTAPSGDLTGTPSLLIDLESPMTNAGGTIVMADIAVEGTCVNADCSTASGPLRFIAGSISGTPVPEPGTLLTLGPLAAIVWWRRRLAKQVL